MVFGVVLGDYIEDGGVCYLFWLWRGRGKREEDMRIECTFTLAPNVSLHAHLFWIGTANKQSLRVNCHKDN